MTKLTFWRCCASLAPITSLVLHAACKPSNQESDTDSAQHLAKSEDEKAIAQHFLQLKSDLQTPFAFFCGVLPGGQTYEKVVAEYEENQRRENEQTKLERQFNLDFAKWARSTKAADIAAWAALAEISKAGDAATAKLSNAAQHALQISHQKLAASSQGAALVRTWTRKVGQNRLYTLFLGSHTKIEATRRSIELAATKTELFMLKSKAVTASAAASMQQLRFVFRVLNTSLWIYEDALAACKIANLAMAILDAQAAKHELKAVEAKMQDIDEKYCCTIHKQTSQWPNPQIAQCTEQKRNPQSCERILQEIGGTR